MENNNLPAPIALAGFFGWLKRTVNNVLNAIVEVSRSPTFIFDIISDALDGDGHFNIGNATPGHYIFR